ncbi:MAG: hypothetical protein KME29_15125 [Calothrix sp. FI2-JRJ7]|jgi:CheY-like chemotaxis protein|nr:hypothetical protein [Calothrix sp. FI2-JRJ7]
MKTVSKTILLVENDSDTKNLISTLFEVANLPVSIQFFENFQEVKDYLLDTNFYADCSCCPLPTVILANAYLPGSMCGFELLNLVKQHSKLKHIPVIIISISDDPYFLIQSAFLGAHSYFMIMSPYDELVDVVAKLIV